MREFVRIGTSDQVRAFRESWLERGKAMIESLGLPVRQVTKKLHMGHPNVVDVIRQAEVQAVVNTMSGERRPLRDGFYIRRAAVERRIPCFTSLDTLRAVVEAQEGGLEFSVQPLDTYLVAEPPKVRA